HQPVGVTQRTRAHPVALLVGREPTGEVGAHEVGTLDEHDGLRCPRAAECGEHGAGVEAHAERRAGIEREESGVDATARYTPRAAWVVSAATALRRYGGTRSSGALGSLPSPFAMTPRAMCARASSSPRRPTSAPYSSLSLSSITSLIGMYTRPRPGSVPVRVV